MLPYNHFYGNDLYVMVMACITFIYIFSKIIIVLLSFSLYSTVYMVYDTGKGHRTDVSAAL